jgi:SAM-dependent methyltransferase
MKDQRDYWNAVAGDKEFTIPLDLDLLRNRVPRDAAVLDYGCGYGRTLAELAKAGYRNLKGVDFSPAMIERGHRLHPNLEMEVVDGPGGLGEGEYGLIILFAVLTCIESDEGQRNLVSRLEDALIPGGCLYAMDFLLNDDSRNLERYRKHETDFERYGTFELGNGGVVRHHDAAWIESLFSEFETLEFREKSFTTMNGNVSKGFSFFGRKADP